MSGLPEITPECRRSVPFQSVLLVPKQGHVNKRKPRQKLMHLFSDNSSNNTKSIITFFSSYLARLLVVVAVKARWSELRSRRAGLPRQSRCRSDQALAALTPVSWGKSVINQSRVCVESASSDFTSINSHVSFSRSQTTTPAARDSRFEAAFRCPAEPKHRQSRSRFGNSRRATRKGYISKRCHYCRDRQTTLRWCTERKSVVSTPP